MLNIPECITKYCVQDTVILLQALKSLRKHAMTQYGVDITNYLSMASMARDVWLRGEEEKRSTYHAATSKPHSKTATRRVFKSTVYNDVNKHRRLMGIHVPGSDAPGFSGMISHAYYMYMSGM